MGLYWAILGLLLCCSILCHY